MTNLGMKIVGAEMEVGFTVSSREEFDRALARLAVIAAGMWPESPADEQQVQPKAASQMTDEEYAVARAVEVAKHRNVWRESQGLR